MVAGGTNSRPRFADALAARPEWSFFFLLMPGVSRAESFLARKVFALASKISYIM
jgi:hypothetical protein